tara:strand:+ start:263 stop:1051 length:789 start_codon:yes stop_codon:yes gene_type:complete
MRIVSLFLIITLLSIIPANVFAQQGQLLQAEPSKVAMQALGLAKHYYSKGDFEKAAELFMEAYQLDARVEFMFNAARAYQRAIKLKKAKSLFNRCVKAKKAPAVVIEKANIYLREIENMEKALSKAKHDGEKKATDAYVVKKPKPKPKPVKKVKKQPKQEWKSTAGTSTLALGAISGTAGVYLLINAYELSGAADKDAKAGSIGYKEYDKQKSKAETQNMLGWGATALGAVSAGFGIWCLVTQPKNVAVVPTPRGVSVAVRF